MSAPEEPTEPVRRLIAVGRLVRLADDPDAAEVAIVVADAWQRRRLGSTLAELLAARARGLGIRRFTATIAGDNEPAHKLLRRSSLSSWAGRRSRGMSRRCSGGRPRRCWRRSRPLPATRRRRSTPQRRGEDAEGASVIDHLGGDGSAYDLVEDPDAIARTWDVLPEIERSVLELRFTHDLNQREIGERLGYSAP